MLEGPYYGVNGEGDPDKIGRYSGHLVAGTNPAQWGCRKPAIIAMHYGTMDDITSEGNLLQNGRRTV